MQTACLYIRVSTDEQAIRGYSQRSQQERLEKFCQSHDIKVTDIVFEDYSAKTFKRPGWSEMMGRFKKDSYLRPDWLLFTKWDRFSRNAGDAYYTINRLRGLGIQPQAIDQTLDLTVPENKIMLAVYLATSEAENERRSLNIRQGIHKAKKEGRFVSKPPFGYAYKLSSEGRKSISPKEPEAAFVRKAFNMLAEGYGNIQSIYRYLVACGMKCSKSNFWRIIRRPFYYGSLLIPAFENEEAYSILGSHEALITEALFDKVQQTLDSKKRKFLFHKEDEALLLRHFLHCPICNKKLTGSASKGRSKRYYYYHCTVPCRFRIRADMVNALFLQELNKLIADEAYLKLYKKILKLTSKDLFTAQALTQKTDSQSIDRLIERILKAKEQLLAGEIEPDDFQIIKTDCESRISLLGIQLQQAATIAKNKESNFKKAISYWLQPGKLFRELGFMEKQKFLEIILSPKPVLNNPMHIQTITCYAVQVIYKLNNMRVISRALTEGTTTGINDNYKEELITKIEEIVATKHQDVSPDLCETIAIFFIDFAKMTIRNI